MKRFVLLATVLIAVAAAPVRYYDACARWYAETNGVDRDLCTWRGDRFFTNGVFVQDYSAFDAVSCYVYATNYDANVAVSIEPPTTATSYGTESNPIAELYVGSNTVYIGGQPIRADADGIKLRASKSGSGWTPQGQIQQRLEAIEKILGLRE